MKLSTDKAVASAEKPKGATGTRGRRESPEWTDVAETIQKQPAGVWVTYPELDGTTDAVRVGMRLRARDSYKEGKAFAPLKDRVKIALTHQRKGEDGKTTATLSIQYNPETKTKAPAKAVKKASTKK